jgi:hypothetical protein
MVIENNKQYSKLIDSISGKDVAIVVIRDDYRIHPRESKVIIASLCCGSERYDIIFSHSESTSNLHPTNIQELKVAKRFWVDDAKQFYHLTGFKNIYDVKIMNWANDKEYPDLPVPVVFDFVYNRTKKDGNKIVPLMKVLEYSRDRLLNLGKMSDELSITRSALKYNRSSIYLANIESVGMKTIDGYWYSNYNMYTLTGRPSNTFGGINFAALPKEDGTRKQIVSRHESGMLIEFDYDAYHLRLLGNILDYKFQFDKSLHQYFADEVYHCTYEEAKTKSFQILYGNLPIDEKRNPFFYGVDRLAHAIQDEFSKHKCFKSHIYKKPFGMGNVIDVNKNKLLNYYTQSYETERNMEVIGRIQYYLREKKTKMILYTYDSFLFDFDIKEGLDIIKELKQISEVDSFPVRVKAGADYDSLKDITARL